MTCLKHLLVFVLVTWESICLSGRANGQKCKISQIVHLDDSAALRPGDNIGSHGSATKGRKKISTTFFFETHIQPKLEKDIKDLLQIILITYNRSWSCMEILCNGSVHYIFELITILPGGIHYI